MNKTMGARRTARAVGILILGGYLSYGLGSIATTAATAPGYLPSAADSTGITAGAVLMLVNSGLVIGIGILLYPVLRVHSPRIALGYVATRLFEGILMAVGIASILTLAALGAAETLDQTSLEALTALLVGVNVVTYNMAMLGLSIGSLYLCCLLVASRLVPRFLGVWGFFGYAIFGAGCVLELLGFTGAGLIATIPGGLWELFFAVWLMAKGFTAPKPAARGAQTAAVAA